MVPRSDDTIAAIATPAGDGAIAVVRLSGRDALKIADRIFRGKMTLCDAPGYTAHPGHILHPGGTLLDRAIATVFKSPHSYTGEDAVEISCHGGSFLTAKIFEALLSAGARAAEPGEFTRRAFMNGKLDLTQAEAVADLIASHSERARRISIEQLQGRFGERIRRLRGQLIELCSILELELDFTEDGIELTSSEEIKENINNVSTSLGEMLSSYASGRLIREGVSVVIVGPPNVGKSSIFNALLQHDRAIVTHVAGTTRDTLEESIILDGILFRLTDTAGIRDSSDVAESKGIDRTFRTVSGADLVLLVADGDSPADELSSRIDVTNRTSKIIVVRNKSDLLPRVPTDAPDSSPPLLYVSARTGYGMDNLRRSLIIVGCGASGSGEDGQILTRERHRTALQSASYRLQSARVSAESGLSAEFVALDVRAAADALGGITGEVTTQEILDSIFSSFCIGK